MSSDNDSGGLHLKCNASGSWMNILTCKPGEEDKVREACVVLAKAARGRLKFKLVDDQGSAVAILDDGVYSGIAWHAAGR